MVLYRCLKKQRGRDPIFLFSPKEVRTLRTEAEIQHGQELRSLLFDGGEIAGFASCSIGFIMHGHPYPSEKDDLERALSLFKTVTRCIEEGAEIRSEIYDGRCRWLVDLYQKIFTDLLPSGSLKPQEVVVKLERLLAGEELPYEELDSLKDHLRTFTGLFHEEMEASTHPLRKYYRGPRRCPVCGKDYEGGPDNCPQGCNPRQKEWVPLEYRGSSHRSGEE